MEPFNGKFLLTLEVNESEDPRIDFHVKVSARIEEKGECFCHECAEVDRPCSICNGGRFIFSRNDSCKHSALRGTIDSQLKSARESIVALIAEEMDP